MKDSIAFSFNETKATQIVAELIDLNRGWIDHYLLAKILYVLDRSALGDWNRPMIGGALKNLPYGPVNQSALDMMQETSGFYADHIARQGNEVKVVRDPGRDELSRVELRMIRRIFKEWASLNFNEAKAKIHELPEAKEPTLSTIPYERVLRLLGKKSDEIREVAQECAFRHKVTPQSA